MVMSSSDGFAIVVLDRDGRVIDYSAPINMSFTLLREAFRLGYDVYRMINVVVKELGYEKPRNMTVKMDDYEVTIFDRGKYIVMAIFSNNVSPPVVRSGEKAIMEA
jgi:predicted regulator of Ras-like GTPase activity (Roadblock/LC7/MglB family)